MKLLKKRKYEILSSLTAIALIFLFQNCGSSGFQTQSFTFTSTCTSTMSRSAHALAMLTGTQTPSLQPMSSNFVSTPAGGSRRVVLDDFLTSSAYLSNMTGALTGFSSLDSSSGKFQVSGTTNSTYGLLQLDLNLGIPIPSGATQIVLSLQVPKSNHGSIVSPLMVISSPGTGTQYLNMSALTCGSSYTICSEAEDYILALDPTQTYTLKEIHLSPAALSGQVLDYTVLFRGLAADIPSNTSLYSKINGPLISHQSWNAELSFDSTSASTLNVKTAVYPYLKDLLYFTPHGNFAVQNRVTATASSSRCYGSWCTPAINALLPGTSWSSDTATSSAGTAATTTYELVFDQNYLMNIYQINIGNHGAPYTVQISSDQSTWTTIRSDPGGSDSAVFSGSMSATTGTTQNSVAALRILFSRPTNPDSSGLYYVSLYGMQLFEAISGLSNGLMPLLNVDNTQAKYLQNFQVSLSAGHQSLPLVVDSLGPGEYVLQTEITQGGTVVQTGGKHFTITRPDRTDSDSFFGLNDEFFDSQDIFVNQLKIQASRVFVNWPSLQTAPGTYSMNNWPGYPDIFQRFSASGTKMHAVINHIPPALSAAPSGAALPQTYAPTDLILFNSSLHNVDYRATEFYRFVKAFVTAYHPWLSTVEIMNEFDINNCVSWQNWQGSFAGKYFDCSTGGTGTAAQYTFSIGSLDHRSQEYMELLRAGYLAVKDVDPGIVVSHAGLAYLDAQTIRNMANYTYYDGHKGSEFFDVFNFHQYWANEAPELSTTNSNSGSSSGSVPFEQNLSSVLQVVKNEFPKDVLMTEFGYDDRFGAYTSTGLAPPSTRKEQAVFNSRALILFKKLGIKQAFPFEALDLWSATTFFGGMGLVDLQSQGKDWLAAWQLLNEQFSGFKWVKSIDRVPHRIEIFQNTQGIQRAFIFKSDPTATTDTVSFSSRDFSSKGGIIRHLIPLLNGMDSNPNSSDFSQAVPFLSPIVVEVGPDPCAI